MNCKHVISLPPPVTKTVIFYAAPVQISTQNEKFRLGYCSGHAGTSSVAIGDWRLALLLALIIGILISIAPTTFVFVDVAYGIPRVTTVCVSALFLNSSTTFYMNMWLPGFAWITAAFASQTIKEERIANM